jgi:hypothetical protein
MSVQPDKVDALLVEFTDEAIPLPPGARFRRKGRPLAWPARWWWLACAGLAGAALLVGLALGLVLGK